MKLVPLIPSQTIRAAKGNIRNIQLPVAERFSKLSNVVATLLHVGMLNIGSNDDELRIAAYDLLCAVCTYLDFEGRPVVPSKSKSDLSPTLRDLLLNVL